MEKYKKIDDRMQYREGKKELLKKYNLKHKTKYKYISEAIKKIYKSGVNARCVGDIFNIGRDAIYYILKKLSVNRRSKGGARVFIILPDGAIEDIRKSCETQFIIAKKYNTSQTTISNIRRRLGKYAEI